MDAMESFWDELETGEVHIRDKWQFEWKSEFFTGQQGKTHYIQDFYLFVPNSLQVNASNYTKAQFYSDQTNLIRYKTPQFWLRELIDPECRDSPLAEMEALSKQEGTPQTMELLSHHLKLLGNVMRSCFRLEVKALLQLLENKQTRPEEFNQKVVQFCSQIQTFRKQLSAIKQRVSDNWNNNAIDVEFKYIDEYIIYLIQAYLSGLLESIRLRKHSEQWAESDQALCAILMEVSVLFNHVLETKSGGPREGAEMEKILYMRGLLNKFVLDALLLSVNRQSLDERYYPWIAGLSAGIAMMIFLILYVWLGNVFVINSLPFVVLTVFIYILKDRIKEGLRFLSARQASRWFPDFTTAILSPEKKRFGTLKETFSFLNTVQLPSEIVKIRNQEFHQILEKFQRPESIIYYKRMVEVENVAPFLTQARPLAINIIFRFNIFRFLRKAGDPYETHLIMDPETQKLVSVKLPKVYHLNLIIRSCTIEGYKTQNVSFKKLRIIIDKNGIKRIEQVKGV